MPSKGIYLVFFLSTSGVLAALQYFVYRQLVRLVRRDFPAKAERRIRGIRWTFILMNLPLMFLFFRRQLDVDVPLLSQIILYPFTVWQFLMIMWAVILAPIVILRMIRSRIHIQRIRTNDE